MRSISKVIAVLNDFEKADVVLKRAFELSLQQKAVLEVLYIYEEPFFELPDFFRMDDNVGDSSIDKKRVKKEIKNRLKDLGADGEYAILIFVDDTSSHLFAQLEKDLDTLVVTLFHEKITKKLVKKSHLPLLIIKNTNNTEDYKKIAIAVDLGEDTNRCINLAKMIFPQADKRLLHDYRYVIDTSLIDAGYLGMPISEPIMNTSLNEEIKQNQLEKFEALKKESGLEGDFIEESLLVEEDLSHFINANHFDLTILYSSKRHFLSLDSTSLLLLETLHTDLLIFMRSED
jgi:nucleotide-binding universal stress UspA family protein